MKMIKMKYLHHKEPNFGVLGGAQHNISKHSTLDLP